MSAVKLTTVIVRLVREELRKKYNSDTDDRVNVEYNRTKQDFYRMELDKMDEYHPSSKPKMKATYYAYLENNPGSKKAIHECIREVESGEKRAEKKVGQTHTRTTHTKKQTNTRIHIQNHTQTCTHKYCMRAYQGTVTCPCMNA